MIIKYVPMLKLIPPPFLALEHRSGQQQGLSKVKNFISYQ